jgi:hypothetical protein
MATAPDRVVAIARKLVFLMKSIPNPDAPGPTPAPGTPRRKFNWSLAVALLSLALIFGVARYAVTHFRRPGSMSVIEAQAMDTPR